jgi:hypothetical protein
MTDSILNRYIDRRAEASQVETAEADGFDDLGSFGWLRGVRDRAIMLELRHKDGTVSAFGYAWLERAEFDASDGISLHFAGKTVQITGRYLNAEARPNVRLFAGIVRHRVPWIQEAGGTAAMATAKGTAIVDSISVKP